MILFRNVEAIIDFVLPKNVPFHLIYVYLKLFFLNLFKRLNQ